jgi:hypothetical protein
METPAGRVSAILLCPRNNVKEIVVRAIHVRHCPLLIIEIPWRTDRGAKPVKNISVALADADNLMVLKGKYFWLGGLDLTYRSHESQ